MMAALQYLKSLCNKHPEISEWYDLLADLYQKKLWHQLYEELNEFARCSVFKDDDAFIQLYHNVFAELETKVKPLEIAHHAVEVSRRYSENEAAIGFLEGVIERLQATKEQRIDETIAFIKIEIASFKLLQRDRMECKKLLQDGKSTLDSMTDVDPFVYASYYLVSSHYHESLGAYSDFYKNALLHAKYIWSFHPPDSFKQLWAFKLCVAALAGPYIYNFGELLVHPIIKSLLGTDKEWLLHILEAINRGDLSGCQETLQKYETAIEAVPELAEHKASLREKVNILRLVDTILREPVGTRTIRLRDIAEHTGLPLQDVEHLLQKSFSAQLIEGTFDQYMSRVHVSWLQPRVVETISSNLLKERIEGRSDE